MANESPAAVIIDSAEKELTLTTDGSDVRAEVYGKTRKGDGTVIDPATEAKQDDSITKLTSLDGKDFATQTTLVTLATEATLTAMKTITDKLDFIINNAIERLETRSSITSPDGASDVGVDNDRLKVVDESYAIARDSIVGADNYRANIDGSSVAYGLAIDLDNAGGFYKHSASATGLELYAVSSTLIKEQTGSDWNVIAGVILTIDGTQASVAWLEFLALHAEDSSTNVVTKNREAFPIPLDLTVAAGALSKIAAGYIQTGITAINTGITLLDIEGVARTPAVGDLVSRVTRTSGSGDATLHASLWYRGVV